MAPILSPNLDFCKSRTGFRPELSYVPMAIGKKRRSKEIAFYLRRTIAANIHSLAALKFPGSDNIPADICKASGRGGHQKLSITTVKRLMDLSGSVSSATLEQLDGLSRAFGIVPHEVLIPELDAAQALKMTKKEVSSAKENAKRTGRRQRARGNAAPAVPRPN